MLLTFALFYLMQESLAEEMIARFNLNKVSLELTLSSLVCHGVSTDLIKIKGVSSWVYEMFLPDHITETSCGSQLNTEYSNYFVKTFLA